MTLKDAGEAMLKANVLSAVVVDEEDMILGMVDMKDFANFYACNYDGTTLSQNKEMQSFSMQDVLDQSIKDFAILKYGSTAHTCATILASGIHRVLLTNENGIIYTMVSQKCLLRYLLSEFLQDVESAVFKTV